MTGFEAQVQHRIFGRVGIATEEITVVFLFSPTEARDQGQGLIGIRCAVDGVGRIQCPSCPYIRVRLYVLGPVGEPMELQLPLPHGGVDVERVAVQGFKSIGGEVEVTETDGVLS